MSETHSPFPTVNFKPVSGGYIYRAPCPWLFGSARHYRVNEAKKAEILAVQTPRNPILFQILLWMAFSLMVAAGGAIVWALTGDGEPTARDLVAWAVIVVIEVFAGLQFLNWRLRCRLRPILADTPTTDERITYRDMKLASETSANTTSVRALALACASSMFAFTAFLVCFVFDLTLGLHLSLLHLAGTVLFGSLSVDWFGRLIRVAELGRQRQ